MVHVMFEIYKRLLRWFALAPIRASVDKHSGSFEGCQNEMHSCGVRNGVGCSRLRCKLLYGGDACLQDFHTVIRRIPIIAEPITVVLQRLFSDEIVVIKQMLEDLMGGGT